MNSLEKVIRNKICLIDANKPESYNCNELSTKHLYGIKLIYEAGNLNNKNIIELMKEITPLFYYIISKYQRENEEEHLIKKFFITIYFPQNGKLIEVKDCFKLNDENPLTSIKIFIRSMKNRGYFYAFIKHFNFQIRLKTEEPEAEEPEEELTTEKEEVILNLYLPDYVKRQLEELAFQCYTNQQREMENKKINLEKKFKSNECVICLNNRPNVLFSKCGHLPSGVKCDKKKSLRVCPVRKTENYIK